MWSRAPRPAFFAAGIFDAKGVVRSSSEAAMQAVIRFLKVA